MATLFAPSLPRRLRRVATHPIETHVFEQVGLFQPPLRSRVAAGVRRGVLDTLMLFAVAALLLVAIGPRAGQYRTMTMLTGSMRPAYPPGALLVLEPVPADDVQVGQVVAFKAPTPDHRVVTHRITEVVQREPLVIRTRGDANADGDPWDARVDDDHVWTVTGVVPGGGSAIIALRRPLVHKVLLYAGPALLCCWLLAGIWRRPDSQAD